MIELLKEISKLTPNQNSFNDLYTKIKLKQLESPNIVESLGWRESFLSNRFFPADEMVKVFNTYTNFQSDINVGFAHKSEVSYYTDNNYLFFDDILKTYFVRRSEPFVEVVTDINSDTLSKSSSHYVGRLIDGGKAFVSPVARNTKLYSTFPTFFVDHSGANKKNFVIPDSEVFGIEIEMKFPTVFSKLRFSNYVGSNFPSWITERDGSLEDKGNAGLGGLELVSPPLSYDSLLKDLKPILTEARKQKGMGHDAGLFYGIHINANIYGKNKDRTAKRLLCLINDPNLRYFWETMSRRRGSAASQQYCAFQNVIYDHALETESAGHYRAAFYRRKDNGTPLNCIEVRIFRSNLKFVSVKISLEITKLALEFAMSDYELNDYYKFKQFIYEKASEDLVKYILASNASTCLDKMANQSRSNQLKATLADF